VWVFDRIKAILLALTLGGVFLSGGGAYAEVYDLYYFWNGTQYKQYWPEYDLYAYQNTAEYPEQLYDPYYQRHVLHYQLYLPQHQAYSYAPCCFGGVGVIPSRASRIRQRPRMIAR